MSQITLDQPLPNGQSEVQNAAEDAAHRTGETLTRPRLTSRRSVVRELLETALIVVAIYCLVNLGSARYVVEGESMAPNFHTDQFIIVSRLAYLFGSPARGDVIVFHNPEDPSHDFIKRVIGLPGETITITDGKVYANDVPLDEPYVAELCQNRRCDGTWPLDSEHYFVLGDNRSHSHDGHSFGALDRSLIIGQAWVRYWPPSDWSAIPHYDYGNWRYASPPTPVSTQ